MAVILLGDFFSQQPEGVHQPNFLGAFFKVSAVRLKICSLSTLLVCEIKIRPACIDVVKKKKNACLDFF